MFEPQQIEFNYKKATQAINYFARNSRNNSISKLKVIKLIWLADRYHIRKYGRPITGDVYYAMPYGPVGSTVKDISELCDLLSEAEMSYAQDFINHQNNVITSKKEVEEKVFSKTDLEALKFVFNNFYPYSPFELAKLSHSYPEWSKFEVELSSKSASRKVMSYLDFFNDPKDFKNDKFIEDKNLLEANKLIVEDQLLLSKALNSV